MLPPESASAIVGEIFGALVIQNTLAAELRELEAAVASSAGELARHAEGADVVQQAAEEALALATQERALRQAAQTKLRCLQSKNNTENSVQQQLEEQRKLCALRERECKEARSRAQQATERHKAATHGLRAERQQARQERRALAVRRVLRLAHERWVLDGLRRAFIEWRCKVVDSGIFDLAHGQWAAKADDERRHEDAALVHAAHEAHSSHAVLLAARDDECRALRQRLAELEGRVALDDERAEALRRATERAAHASASLLDARRQGCELAAALAAANAALERRALERRAVSSEDA